MDKIFTSAISAKLLSTIVFVLLILLARHYVVRWVKNNGRLRSTHKRQWIVRVRNITIFLIMGMLVVIWLEQLRTVAASVVVIAAAIVIATKEFLLNVVGFFYRTTAKFISVGDRIEVDGTRGDIIDQNLMGITLLEVGPGDKSHQYTGLTIFLPNSLFLSATIKNETFLWSEYVFHLMTVPIHADQNWQAAEKRLLQAAADVCAPYLDKAHKAMTQQALQQSLEKPSTDPRVQIQMADPDNYNLILRVAVPARKRGRLEQEIVRRYLELMDDNQPIKS